MDAALREDASGDIWCGEELFGFLGFATRVGDCFEGLTLIGRGTDDETETAFRLESDLRLEPLPHYPSLRDLAAVLAALPAALRALWRSLDEVDRVWVSAAHPLGLFLIAFAALRGRRAAILARQDSMAYFRSRLPGPRWAPLLAPLWLIDRAYRLLGRRLPVTAVGEEVAAQFGAPRPNVLTFTVNRVSREQIPAQPPQRGEGGPLRLLTVGRIEQEKNPELLADLLAELDRERPGGYRATWVGSGRMSEALRARAEALGVSQYLDLPGFVPYGPELERYYAEADCFVHISLTEGVPGVVAEALAHGLPVVATDVGGIRAATADGEAALLVPPRDAGALRRAVLRMEQDPELRLKLATRGLEIARGASLEGESERVARFLGGSA